MTALLSIFITENPMCKDTSIVVMEKLNCVLSCSLQDFNAICSLNSILSQNVCLAIKKMTVEHVSP